MPNHAVRPDLIAMIRRLESMVLVVFLNCRYIGWPAALLVACILPRREDQLGSSARIGLTRRSQPKRVTKLLLALADDHRSPHGPDQRVVTIQRTARTAAGCIVEVNQTTLSALKSELVYE